VYLYNYTDCETDAESDITVLSDVDSVTDDQPPAVFTVEVLIHVFHICFRRFLPMPVSFQKVTSTVGTIRNCLHFGIVYGLNLLECCSEHGEINEAMINILKIYKKCY